MVAQQCVLAWLLCDFPGDSYKYCLETFIFLRFSVGGGPPIPSHPLDPCMLFIWSTPSLFTIVLLAESGFVYLTLI